MQVKVYARSNGVILTQGFGEACLTDGSLELHYSKEGVQALPFAPFLLSMSCSAFVSVTNHGTNPFLEIYPLGFIARRICKNKEQKLNLSYRVIPSFDKKILNVCVDYEGILSTLTLSNISTTLEEIIYLSSEKTHLASDTSLKIEEESGSQIHLSTTYTACSYAKKNSEFSCKKNLISLKRTTDIAVNISAKIVSLYYQSMASDIIKLDSLNNIERAKKIC